MMTCVGSGDTEPNGAGSSEGNDEERKGRWFFQSANTVLEYGKMMLTRPELYKLSARPTGGKSVESLGPRCWLPCRFVHMKNIPGRRAFRCHTTGQDASTRYKLSIAVRL